MNHILDEIKSTAGWAQLIQILLIHSSTVFKISVKSLPDSYYSMLIMHS